MPAFFRVEGQSKWGSPTLTMRTRGKLCRIVHENFLLILYLADLLGVAGFRFGILDQSPNVPCQRTGFRMS